MERKRIIRVIDKPYCKDCCNENLELSHSRLYSDCTLEEDDYTLQCEHYASCSQLWNHFASSCKEHINDLDEKATTTVIEDGE